MKLIKGFYIPCNHSAKEIHDSAASADYIVNNSVSEDSTWQRKGFYSLNGVFTAISIESGKVLGVQNMPRYRKGCNVFERSIKKHKLRYVELLGDGDAKS